MQHECNDKQSRNDQQADKVTSKKLSSEHDVCLNLPEQNLLRQMSNVVLGNCQSAENVECTLQYLTHGLIYGFFKEGISYEAHLSGFLAGILYAYWFKAKLIPEVKIKKSNIGQIYVDQYWQEQNNTIDQAVNFEYTFIEKEDPQD